jgi:hypothetical protein
MAPLPAMRLGKRFFGSSTFYAEPNFLGIRAGQMSWFSRAMDFLA